jgi:CubicO group peptidase (beta-lactamase class C family)
MTRRALFRRVVWPLFIAVAIGACASRESAPPRRVATLEQRFYVDRLPALDAAVNRAIEADKLPGGVLWLERDGAVYAKAFGRRAVEPSPEPMTLDTRFDAASLTKVLATAPAVMQLVERGRIDLDAPVARYWPGFAQHGKEAVTVRHLLTHTSGLRPSLPAAPPWNGVEQAAALIEAESLQQPPGTKFVYSDINFITLGELVRRVSGSSLDAWCARELYGPLGMHDTGFLPFPPGTSLESLSAIRADHIAPTEHLTSGPVLRGVVHDPTSRRMGGVAGHAGLFTTSADVARFCRMILAGGVLDGRRVLQASTVAAMSKVQTPDGIPQRGLGWDINSPYAGQRGNKFPVGGYGHTGWTGGSIWIDPGTATIVIFLSNRNHPTEAGNVIALRRELGTLAAEAVRDAAWTNLR